MVSLGTDSANRDMVFTIQRNCSLSWNQTKVAFYVLCASIVTVATYFMTLGAWLVAPFSGLEIALVGTGMYLSARSGAKREVIRINNNNVVVYRGSRMQREIKRFPRSWARVGLTKDPNNWYPSRLFLRSHGESVEVGNDLLEVERLKLAGDLNEILGFQPDPETTEDNNLQDYYSTQQ